MNDKFLFSNKKQKTRRVDSSQIVRIILLIIASIIIIYVATIPWRNFVSKGLIKKGDQLLSDRNYTEAYVNFEKASLLTSDGKTAKEKMQTAKSAAANIATIKDILGDKNPDLLKVIEIAEQKSCNLDQDQTMIDNNLSQIAIINLEFCANDGPANYPSWLYLGIAYLRFSESNNIFKEQKPELREKSISALERAYYADPTQKTALEYLIEVNKNVGNSNKVDYWQKLLDNLIKISS